MNKTNLAAALALASFTFTNTVRTTNWINTGNSEYRNGTNYVEQLLGEIVITDFRREAVPCIVWTTNSLPIHIVRELFPATNTVKQMNQCGNPPMPPVPNVPGKL